MDFLLNLDSFTYKIYKKTTIVLFFLYRRQLPERQSIFHNQCTRWEAKIEKYYRMQILKPKCRACRVKICNLLNITEQSIILNT